MLSTPAITVVEPYPVIFENDPALDKGDDFDAIYCRSIETGRIDELKTKPGEKATVFYLRHPTGELIDILKDLWNKHDGPNMVASETVAYCLVKVENWGKDEPTWNGVKDKRGHSLVPSETIDILRKIPGLIPALYTAVWTNMRPSPS